MGRRSFNADDVAAITAAAALGLGAEQIAEEILGDAGLADEIVGAGLATMAGGVVDSTVRAGMGVAREVPILDDTLDDADDPIGGIADGIGGLFD